MTRRAAGLTSVVVAALVATVLVGSQVLASTGATTPRLEPLVPVASSNAPDDEGDEDDGDGDGGSAPTAGTSYGSWSLGHDPNDVLDATGTDQQLRSSQSAWTAAGRWGSRSRGYAVRTG